MGAGGHRQEGGTEQSLLESLSIIGATTPRTPTAPYQWRLMRLASVRHYPRAWLAWDSEAVVVAFLPGVIDTTTRCRLMAAGYSFVGRVPTGLVWGRRLDGCQTAAAPEEGKRCGKTPAHA